MTIVDARSDHHGALEKACAVLRSGHPVAIPTETVYGLAGDIHAEHAIRRIFEIKGRPASNPLICHVSSIEMACEYVHFDDLALSLANAFWPGPLTLVLPRKMRGAALELASAGLSTLAVRIPQGFSRELIECFGRGLAAPSANISGRVSPTSAVHVQEGLGQRVGLIVDGGTCGIGVESTVVEISECVCALLRPGGLDVSMLERMIGRSIETRSDHTVLKSPGMMASHYAPRARVRLDALEVFPDEALLTFGACSVAGAEAAKSVQNLSVKGSLEEAAARLFDAMLVADRTGATTIAVVPIPLEGLGLAINDRLRRSAAPRIS